MPYNLCKHTLAVCLATALAASCASQDPWKQLPQIAQPTFPDKTFVITDYHIGTDTLYTAAIAAAINDCASKGGGTVLVPNGIFLTAPIRLKSNVNLHLADSAVLRFITDRTQFDTVLTRIEGMDCYNISPLIYARGCRNIAVTGRGILDGQASRDNWLSPDRRDEKKRLYQYKNDSAPVAQRVFAGIDGMRPQFINFYECDIVLLEDITLHRSPFWLIHPLLSKNVTLRRVKMQSHGANNDGCDPESCDGVLIEDCDFDTGDDCIAIKSGRDQDGRRWHTPSQNIIVRSCRMKDGHAGVAIGSEISGSCYNVWVENCQMDSPDLDRIIRIKSNADRGGEVANVFVRNITVGECRLAILGIEQHYQRVKQGPYLPYFHNVLLENITSKKSRYVLHLDGFADHPQARDITFRNCTFDGVTEPSINDIEGGANITFENVVANGKMVKLENKK